MMAKNPRDLRTEAIVLRRTDYGEADRILQLLTPEGKRSVIAKGVRKEKSKLAGGIELFSVSEVVIHEGRTEMGILTGAKLLEYYDAFVKDIELIEMGGAMMRSVSARAEQVESPEFYKILKQSLQVMQKHAGEESRWKDVLRAWWGINLTRVSGEDVNLKFDTDGEKLLVDGRYYWDEEQSALAKAAAGRIGADHIKMMRLMASGPAELSMKVTGADNLIDEVLYVARCMEKVTQI
ncbi:MAG: DNA repair protein RecO [Candidatus Saccharibacteria bacterium]|nr:DNA repair protein RecO [Candidatus Saccharibacteria bacterium]